MSAASLYPVRPEVAANTLTDEATYKAMYQQSVVNPDGFWREQAKRLDWIKPFTTVKQTSFDDHHVDIKWFADGTLNVSYNCLDRHLAERGDQAAIIWEGDDPAESRTITYRELHEEVCKFANALRGQDVHRGDVVTIYMPMIPEAVVAMLACTRIGAIHSVVFGGFSPEALAGRIIDCKSKVVITADEGIRAGKKIPLKANVDDALTNPETSSIQKVIVCKRTNGNIKWNQHRDIWYEDLMKVAGTVCAPKEMGAEEALFILYTSGSTGKPKGVLLSHAAHLWVVRTRLQATPLTHETPLIAAPLYHMNALALALLSLASHTSTVLLAQFTAPAYIAAIEQQACTWLTAVPPMIAMMLREKTLLAAAEIGRASCRERV
mgnify:CR=1 FL=1